MKNALLVAAYIRSRAPPYCFNNPLGFLSRMSTAQRGKKGFSLPTDDNHIALVFILR